MNILLADDHSIVREGIKVLLLAAYPFAAVTVVGSVSEMMKLLPEKKWDVIITDITMPPGDSGLEAIKLIREQLPKTPVIILSMHSVEQYAVRAIKAGASGYLNKAEASNELVKAVSCVLGGRKYLSSEVSMAMADTIENSDATQSIENLSNRELEVFKMMASGSNVTSIAKQLGLQTNTISAFRANIFEKMNFLNNTELIKYAVDHKFV
jgi:DNA-binding NarL/FixJ family response regulator